MHYRSRNRDDRVSLNPINNMDTLKTMRGQLVRNIKKNLLRNYWVYERQDKSIAHWIACHRKDIPSEISFAYGPFFSKRAALKADSLNMEELFFNLESDDLLEPKDLVPFKH